MPQAWKIIGKCIQEQVDEREKYVIKPEKILDDLAIIGFSNVVSYADNTLMIQNNNRIIRFHFKDNIEGNYKNIIEAKGFSLLSLYKKVLELIESYSQEIQIIETLSKKFIVDELEDDRIFIFDGNSSHELEFKDDNWSFKNRLYPRSPILKLDVPDIAAFDDYSCGICFSVFLVHTLPSIRCELCKKTYHRLCLKEWFEVEGDFKYLNFNSRIKGNCLFCSNKDLIV